LTSPPSSLFSLPFPAAAAAAEKQLRQWLISAEDHPLPGGLQTRLRVRPDHLKHAYVQKQTGKLLHGGAILNEQGQMVGSSMITHEAFET